MRDYGELVNALKACSGRDGCLKCPRQNAKSFANDCAMSAVRDAADAIEELVEMVPRWISVKKSPPKEYSTPLREKCGLPPVSDTVLITLIDPDVVDGKKDPYKGDRVVIADRFSNGELVQHKMLASQKTRPIAWMPLPEAPKEVV